MDFPPHSANDAWSPGAYIRILGPDGQLLYIGVMTEKEQETHEFSRWSCMRCLTA